MMRTSLAASDHQWTLIGYSNLLARLQGLRVPVISLHEFADGDRGVWLRHDVELDLGAAIAVARVENSAGFRSSYFVCPESPFIDAGNGNLRDWARELKGLGHSVSLHMLLGAGIGALQERVEEAAWKVGIDPPESLTFHAPGLDAEILAQAPGGELVYGRLGAQRCVYLSDSTSRWRWGSPWDVDLLGKPSQLLTHPFWWAGNRSRVVSLCRESDFHAAFLPQFKTEVLGL